MGYLLVRVALVGVLAAPQQTEPVLTKLGAYVDSYGEQVSALVGIEHYTQTLDHFRNRRPEPRTLVADFAIVKTGTGWIGFRDVVEVNGKAVTDRRERLVALLSSPAPSASELRRIADESARHNIGTVYRNLNLPTTALFFFTSRNLSRFAFEVKGTKDVDGTQAVEIDFVETAKPTLVMTRKGQDVPIKGTLWLEPVSGVVVRTRLVLRGFANEMLADSQALRSEGELVVRELRSFAEIVVTYRRDERLAVWLPATMEETYEGPVGVGTGGVVAAVSRAKALYSNYRQFGTGARIKLPK